MSKSRAFSIVLPVTQADSRNRALQLAGIAVQDHLRVRPTVVQKDRRHEMLKGKVKHRGRLLDY